MNITLIGMPGAGKSYIGKALAKRLGYDFLDIDLLIEEKFGKKLLEISREMGEAQFIEEEAKAVLSLQGIDSTVISPGGSIVYSAPAMDYVRKISKVIFLNVPLSVISRRIDVQKRGIIGIGAKSLEGLYSERLPLYRQYSGVIIDLDGSESTEEILEKIIKEIQ